MELAEAVLARSTELAERVSQVTVRAAALLGLWVSVELTVVVVGV